MEQKFLSCKAVAALKRKNRCHLFKVCCVFESKSKSQDNRGGRGSVNPLLVTPAMLMKTFKRMVGMSFILSCCPAGSRSLKDAGWDQAESSCRNSWSLTEPSQRCHRLSRLACASVGEKVHALRPSSAIQLPNKFDWHVTEM